MKTAVFCGSNTGIICR